jgi:hypothetical protein
MSDDNDSGGMIGTIISILILIAIWPYLLAILGLYIAYLAVVAALEWIAQNPLIVVLILLTVLSASLIWRYQLISKAWVYMMKSLKSKATTVYLNQDVIDSERPDLANRNFVPSSNLYCYWCTKKLGINAWEKESRYYCGQCKEKMMSATGYKNP